MSTPNSALLDLAGRVRDAKRRIRLNHTGHGKAHGVVKRIFTHPDNPHGVEAKVKRLMVLDELRHIDRNTPGHQGGFKSYARHAR